MRYFFSIGVFLISFTCQAIDLKTVSGYESEAYTYSGDADKIAIVFLHGKSGRPDVGFLEELYSELSDAGHAVIAPTMPWSRDKRDGTLEDAMQVIDAAATYLADKSKGVVIMGHSMGAVGAMIYASRNPAKNVVGITLIAPGHMPHISNLMSEITEESVSKARALAGEGKLKQLASFEDLNMGQATSFETTVEYYLSFYDQDKFPNVYDVMPKIKLPALWISGRKDRLTHKFDHETMFESVAKNEKNRFEMLKGKHKSVVKFSGPTINQWLGEL